MPKTYTKCDKDTREMLAEVMKTYHPTLDEAGIRVDVLMVRPQINETTGDPVGHAVTFAGAAAVAKIARVSAKDRVNVKFDAIIQIDEQEWDALREEQRRALLDHELCHIETVEGSEGEKFALYDDGRPKLRMRPDDILITGFECVIRRHGENALEAQSLSNAWRIGEQALLDFAKADVVPAEEEEAATGRGRRRETAVA